MEKGSSLSCGPSVSGGRFRAGIGQAAPGTRLPAWRRRPRAQTDLDRLDHGNGPGAAEEPDGDHAVLRANIVEHEVYRLAQSPCRGGHVHIADRRLAVDLDVGDVAARLRRLSRLAELQPHVVSVPRGHRKVGRKVPAVDAVAVQARGPPCRPPPSTAAPSRTTPAPRSTSVPSRMTNSVAGPPGVARRIDVILAAHVAEDHPLRLGRAAACAEAALALGGRPLHGVHVDPRAGRDGVLRARGHDLQPCAAPAQGRSCSRGPAGRGPAGTRSRCRRAASLRRDTRRHGRRLGRRGRSAGPGCR